MFTTNWLNLFVDESAHVNETPVKDLDVANFSTMWAALSGEVDMSRARHFSNMSTQSDKSSYSDLSAVISPVNSERVSLCCPKITHKHVGTH